MNIQKETSNIHLLLIDDNSRYLARLLRRLQSFGYQHLTSAESAAEGKQRLREQHFDIIVADMRMEQDDSGFAVIDAVRSGNLSSIVIILTANETVDDCRKALKQRGAWDYIRKTTGSGKSGMEELHESIQEAIIYFNRWGNVQDEAWIQEHREELQRQYPGQWIAVFNHAVIDAADTRKEIEQRIQERRLPNLLTIVRQIEPPIKAELSAELTIFVEGPTDVQYITVALRLLERADLLEKIEIETIGSATGQHGSGWKNLAHGFDFLKHKPKLRPNKVLFLFDQDVKDKDLPNAGQDFENLSVRRIAVYSSQKAGIEYLFPDSLLKEAFDKGFVVKDLGRASREIPCPQPTYQIKEKMSLCQWICKERENQAKDFQGFRNIIQIIESVLTQSC